MKKLMMLLGIFYCGMISSSFATFEQLNFDSDFKDIKQDVSELEENIKKLHSCFQETQESSQISQEMVLIFEKIKGKAENDKNFKSFLDNFSSLICEEKEAAIGLLSVGAIQEKFINPVFDKLFKKPTVKTWEACFKETCIIGNEEYFEIFKLPYHQLLLNFFFNRGISHDFYFLKSNLYQAIVSTPKDLLSLRLLTKHEFSSY